MKNLMNRVLIVILVAQNSLSFSISNDEMLLLNEEII
jgi:hypothetical protein